MSSHVVKHYEESAIAISVFDQLRPFIDKSAEREIRGILAKKGNMTNDEFKNYFEVLDKFEKLAREIPLRVKFTLFDVDCTQVRDAIIKSITDF